MITEAIIEGRMLIDEQVRRLTSIYLGSTKVWPLDPEPIPEPTVILPEDTVAGDVLYTNGAALNFTDGSLETAQFLKRAGHTPIGVVVVPGTHNVYGDGSCGVISLKYMSYTDPENGSYRGLNGSGNGVYLYWGQYSADLGITNHTTVARGNTEDGSATGSPTYYSYLPSDKFNAVQCLHDTDAYYYSSDTSSRPPAPSPYKTDGSRNPGYSQTSSPSSSSNVLSDFDGIGNSRILRVNATAQSSWQTASTITNNSGNGYSPAACCCWRYHTEGTQQGDWYLPAGGELGYIMPSFNKVNEVINNIQDTYEFAAGAALNDSYGYWSSSEHDSDYACGVYPFEGGVNVSSLKSNTRYVRAFLRVNKGGIVSGIAPA